MSNSVCLFCCHALDGRSKKFCTRCLPPLGEWPSQREYMRQYHILRCAVGIGTEGMEKCPIPKGHPAYYRPPTTPKPPTPKPCARCGVIVETGAKHCAPCLTAVRSEAARRQWQRIAAQRPPDWQPSNEWRRRQRLRQRAAAKRRSGTKPTVAKLAERDGWSCHICGKRIDPELTGTKSKYKASVDHLIPLSANGQDEMWNCKLAHLRCNAKRGAGGAAQLMLAVDHAG